GSDRSPSLCGLPPMPPRSGPRTLEDESWSNGALSRADRAVEQDSFVPHTPRSEPLPKDRPHTIRVRSHTQDSAPGSADIHVRRTENQNRNGASRSRDKHEVPQACRPERSPSVRQTSHFQNLLSVARNPTMQRLRRYQQGQRMQLHKWDL